MKFGYVVDFVDITEEYEETHRKYLEELRNDIADEDEEADIDDIFVDVEEVKKQLKVINNKLFRYMGNIEANLEDFRKQIEVLEDVQLKELRSNLDAYKECYNELRIAREDVSNMPIEKVKEAYKEVNNRVRFKRDEEQLEDPDSEIDDIDFSNLVVEFLKIGEVDLDFTTGNDILEIVSAIQNEFHQNLDKQDQAYFDLNKTFKTLMLNLKHHGDNSEKVKEIIVELKSLLEATRRLNSENYGIMASYKGDDSCMRIHKQLVMLYDDLDDVTVYAIMMEIIGEMDKLLGGIQPTVEIMTRQLMRPVRDAFIHQGIQLGKSQVVDVIRLFSDDKFK